MVADGYTDGKLTVFVSNGDFSLATHGDFSVHLDSDSWHRMQSVFIIHLSADGETGCIGKINIVMNQGVGRDESGGPFRSETMYTFGGCDIIIDTFAGDRNTTQRVIAELICYGI